MAAYFNRALLKRNLTRFWPLSFGCFIVAFFVFIAPELGRDNSVVELGRSDDVLMVLSGYCASAVPIFSIFSALAVFGYLHNQKAAGFISALPISRLGLYITNYVSGLALILVPNLLAGIFFGFALIGYQVAFSVYLSWIGIMIASHLLFYSMAVFAAFLTGNPFMQMLFYALINFIYPLFYLIASAASQLLVYGFNGSLPFVEVLSPPIAMFSTLGWRPSYRCALWAGYLVFAAVLIVCGYLLYRRRRIESAGDTVIHNPLKPVFKYIVAFITGTLLGALLVGILGGYDSSGLRLAAWLAISAAFFGSLGCLFIEMLIRKRLKVWKTAWKGILLYICAVTAIALFIRFDGTGFERRVPDADNIAAVSVMRWNRMDDTLLYGNAGVPEGVNIRNLYVGGYNWRLSDAYVKRQLEMKLPLFDDEILNEIKLRNPEYFESPEGIDAALELHRELIHEKSGLENFSGPTMDFVFTYKMKDGNVITRRYALPRSGEYNFESVNRTLELYNLTEAVDKRNRFLSLPDNNVVSALAVNIYRGYEEPEIYIQEYSEKYEDIKLENAQPLIEGEDLKILLDALRSDANTGTLGRVSWDDITDYQVYTGYPQGLRVEISLAYNESLLNSAFNPDELYGGDNNVVRGLVLTVRVNEDCLNSVRVLNNLSEKYRFSMNMAP